MRAVDEVAILRLPQRQTQRVGDIAELKTHHGVFAERAVVSFELRVTGCHLRQRHIDRAGFVVVKCGMALAESAADGILAAQANRGSLKQQAPKCKGFGEHAQSMELSRKAAARLSTIFVSFG